MDIITYAALQKLKRSLYSVRVDAGAAISALKVVKIEDNLAYAASSTISGDSGKIVGIATTGADLGASLLVRIMGEMSNDVWAWTPGPLFINETGDLVSTPPATGFVQRIGRAISPTKIIVDIEQPIMRI
ncbi:MAG: hypothetical protein H7842_12915 [Gammaproteobacteria bacterium SHHR-1]